MKLFKIIYTTQNYFRIYTHQILHCPNKLHTKLEITAGFYPTMYGFSYRNISKWFPFQLSRKSSKITNLLTTVNKGKEK